MADNEQTEHVVEVFAALPSGTEVAFAPPVSEADSILTLRQRIATSLGKTVGEIALLTDEGEMLRDAGKIGDIKGCPSLSLTVVVRRQWGDQLQECICRNESRWTAGLATATDGLLYAINSNGAKEDLQQPIHKKNVMKEDGSEFLADIDEASCLREIMETGWKPCVGLWIGGRKYMVVEFDRHTPTTYGKLKTLVCIATTSQDKPQIVAVSTGSNIVIGLLKSSHGDLGNLRARVTSFAEFLASQGM